MMQSMESQRVRHDGATEQQQIFKHMKEKHNFFDYKHSPIITFEYIELFFLSFTTLNNYNFHVWLFD